MKIGFILSSSVAHPLASTRIAVLNIIPFLERAGHETKILFASEVPMEAPTLTLDADEIANEGFQVVCFQKVAGPSAIALSAALQRRGVKTIAAICDYVYADLARATDTTLIVTEYLHSLYPEELQRRCRVVHDGIENPELEKTVIRPDRGSARHPLRAVLVAGTQLNEVPVLHKPPEWLEVRLVAAYSGATGVARLRELRARLHGQRGWRAKWRFIRFLLSARITCVPWDPLTVHHELQTADIGIIAFETPADADDRIGAPRWKVKSENRLTMMMSAGLPVVATPIPAYEAIVDQGDNAFLVSTRAEWLEALDQLRDPERRRLMGQRARASVLDRFSKEAQTSRWLALLDEWRTPLAEVPGRADDGENAA